MPHTPTAPRPSPPRACCAARPAASGRSVVRWRARLMRRVDGYRGWWLPRARCRCSTRERRGGDGTVMTMTTSCLVASGAGTIRAHLERSDPVHSRWLQEHPAPAEILNEVMTETIDMWLPGDDGPGRTRPGRRVRVDLDDDRRIQTTVIARTVEIAGLWADLDETYPRTHRRDRSRSSDAAAVTPPTGHRPDVASLAPSSLTDRARRNLAALDTLAHIDQRGGDGHRHRPEPARSVDRLGCAPAAVRPDRRPGPVRRAAHRTRSTADANASCAPRRRRRSTPTTPTRR